MAYGKPAARAYPGTANPNYEQRHNLNNSLCRQCESPHLIYPRYGEFVMSSINPDHPVLYLDFDGVLHPDAVYNNQGRFELRAVGHELFEAAQILEQLLAPYPVLQLVLSTSWVRILGLEAARAQLSNGLAARVVGATWEPEYDQFEWLFMPRHEQIAQHLASHQIRHWVAIDDDHHEWPAYMASNLVRVSSELGLQEETAQIALSDTLAKFLDSP